MWARRGDAPAVADRASVTLQQAGVAAEVSILRVSPGGVRARWLDAPETRLAKAVG
jgi:hypothetical protein